MRLLIMGPPGAGKGTQALRLQQLLGAPHISTGDIFRANVASETDLGRAAQGFMDKGEYVPDELTNAMVSERLSQPDVEAGFILDGYPRTAEQVLRLEDFLGRRGLALDAVPCLVVPRDDLLDRLTARAAESGRADDTADVVMHRLDVYDRQTAPLLDLYRERRLLREVPGTGSPDDVTRRLFEALHRTVDPADEATSA
ncbi:adenylate kinase [Nocardioides sp. LS1]|uniref:adenylate kinase n=1 Tax=Nocardioides sp. LS1 TaxID=1027620 RepID=UPI000F622B9B|nr:adenylate kinase [Nocardioides sp. LS1]GCD88188.1 adenylate kinase [Nocardioides sp. LS1]